MQAKGKLLTLLLFSVCNSKLRWGYVVRVPASETRSNSKNINMPFTASPLSPGVLQQALYVKLSNNTG